MTGTRDTWKYRMKLELGSYPTAPSVIREEIRHVLNEWGMPAYFQTARIVASELINNAIQATHGIDGYLCKGRIVPGRPPIKFYMRSDGGKLLIEVWDASPRMPIMKEPTEITERGRGLVIVDNLTSSWGHFLPDAEHENSGKIVWANITQP